MACIFHFSILSTVEKVNKKYTAKVCFENNNWHGDSFLRYHYEVWKKLSSIHARPIQCIPNRVELITDATFEFEGEHPEKKPFECDVVLETYGEKNLEEYMREKQFNITAVVGYLI